MFPPAASPPPHLSPAAGPHSRLPPHLPPASLHHLSRPCLPLARFPQVYPVLMGKGPKTSVAATAHQAPLPIASTNWAIEGERGIERMLLQALFLLPFSLSLVSEKKSKSASLKNQIRSVVRILLRKIREFDESKGSDDSSTGDSPNQDGERTGEAESSEKTE